jgi:hypothetical protein
MSKLSATPAETFNSWEARVQTSLRGCGSLEEAAQRCATMLYDQFRESLILARFYAVLPFGKLPLETRRFASEVATSRGAKESLEEETRVLTLLGTRGDVSSWNDRRTSRGHQAIPLVSAAFVEEIPMVSRMLKELGFPLEWVTDTSKAISTDTFGTIGGFFYVEDAETAVDQSGRKIISAQDFVTRYNVKTVFGTAGMYFRPRMLMTVIAFCRDTLDRSTMRQTFMPLGGVITNATSDIVRRGKFFAGAA